MRARKLEVGQVWLVHWDERDDLIFHFEIVAAVTTPQGDGFVAIKHLSGEINNEQVMIFDRFGEADGAAGKWHLVRKSKVAPIYRNKPGK